MKRRTRALLLATLVLSILVVVPAAAHARAVYSASRPVLSATPVSGVPFTASGTIRPQSTAGSPAVVKLKLFTLVGGSYVLTGTYRARLSDPPPGTPGTAYRRTLTVAAEGKYGLQAFQYRRGTLVSKSKARYFEVAKRVTVDSNVNGWMAPDLAETVVSPDTPLDVVFTTPADWASDDPAKHYGAAHFIWGDFEKVDADGLIWHTDGLAPGRYEWMRDDMPKYGTGSLVVAQRIDVDKASHDDTHALPYLPADVSFGDVSSAGMGCDRSIAFPNPLQRVFAQTSADPLVWHTAGLAPGRYDWKCWMDDCHYGTLVADGVAQTVPIDTDTKDSVTKAPSGTSLDLVFTSGTGLGMVCWRTLYFTTAGDLTRTRGYPDPVTWRTAGLAPGDYEWQCWMGPQCHHGTISVTAD